MVVILSQVIKVASGRVTFEEKPEGGEGGSHVGMGGRACQPEGKQVQRRQEENLRCMLQEL